MPRRGLTSVTRTRSLDAAVRLRYPERVRPAPPAAAWLLAEILRMHLDARTWAQFSSVR